MSMILCRASSCNKDNNAAPITDLVSDDRLKITVGSTVFTATLYDNPTGTALKAMLPLTLNVTDLNNNEKYYHFSSNLPANAQNVGTIHIGDLMLYGSNSFVLFYKTFNTSYTYTPIGKIDNTSGLQTALGSGNITVTFELE